MCLAFCTLSKVHKRTLLLLLRLRLLLLLLLLRLRLLCHSKLSNAAMQRSVGYYRMRFDCAPPARQRMQQVPNCAPFGNGESSCVAERHVSACDHCHITCLVAANLVQSCTVGISA